LGCAGAYPNLQGLVRRHKKANPDVVGVRFKIQETKASLTQGFRRFPLGT
jgi:hypothetical protein